MDVGLYGKLPSHGDFLRRRVDDGFIGVWDAWLQDCIASSRTTLGKDWLDVYLTSPAWRFICDSGVCGSRVYAGLMVPSVDRVGRYFPLTLVWAAPEVASPFTLARLGARWFDAAEKLVVETLAADRIDFDEFDRRLEVLGRELDAVNWTSPVTLDFAQAATAINDANTPWQMPLGGGGAFGDLAEQLLYARLSATHRPLAIFWTEGSAAIEPSCLVMRGLPPPTSFAALLDGSWRQAGWRSIAAKVAEVDYADTLVSEAVHLSYRSAALSDVGHTRSTNQDAFLERPEIGLWVVADGMGGHKNGDLASRMVCDVLSDLVPADHFEATVEAVEQRLRAVNAHLYRAATHPDDPVQSGTTAVCLLVRGDRLAILWVGDSRVYRLRNGELMQLTTDHSWATEGDDMMSDSNVITRAVGGDTDLALDVHRDRVLAGDRFLLCSDGLTRQLNDLQIATLLHQNHVSAATHNLITATLDTGAPDNVTVVVVEAYAAFDSDY
ncbi:MAG TPA: type VI secretion system-associated protein TagF [Steroidobacteraceae bacterium]|nr:type VI secretion system-associated protein TagF [Steroidobacteraceae bacterium]